MIVLRVHELAQARGFSQSTLSRAANVPLSTVRRYWHNSATGLARDTGTLREVNLRLLGAIATTLAVKPGDLLSERLL
jgi:DNA-binding Xre family transcriptional regulator